MTGYLLAALGSIGTFIVLAALGDMVSEEVRDRLDHLPHAILRLAARRLDPAERVILYQEVWLPDLAYYLKGDEARPVTRLIDGITYAIGILISARRSARYLQQGAAPAAQQPNRARRAYTTSLMARLILRQAATDTTALFVRRWWQVGALASAGGLPAYFLVLQPWINSLMPTYLRASDEVTAVIGALIGILGFWISWFQVRNILLRRIVKLRASSSRLRRPTEPAQAGRPSQAAAVYDIGPILASWPQTTWRASEPASGSRSCASGRA